MAIKYYLASIQSAWQLNAPYTEAPVYPTSYNITGVTEDAFPIGQVFNTPGDILDSFYASSYIIDGTYAGFQSYTNIELTTLADTFWSNNPDAPITVPLLSTQKEFLLALVGLNESGPDGFTFDQLEAIFYSPGNIPSSVEIPTVELATRLVMYGNLYLLEGEAVTGGGPPPGTVVLTPVRMQLYVFDDENPPDLPFVFTENPTDPEAGPGEPPIILDDSPSSPIADLLWITEGGLFGPVANPSLPAGFKFLNRSSNITGVVNGFMALMEDALPLFVDKEGFSEVQDSVDLNHNKMVNLADATAVNDVITKAQLDAIV